MTDYADAQTILDAKLATVTGIPAITTENERIKTGTTTSFCRSYFEPTETEQECIGVLGTDRLNGLFIVDLFYPKDAGVADPNADIDAITVAFEAGTILTDLSDNKVEIFNSWSNGSLPDLEKFYRKQVLISWRARRQRSV